MTDGQSASVGIIISTDQGSNPSYFVYNVKFIAARVNTATLILSQIDSFASDVEVDLQTSQSGYMASGTASSVLAPKCCRITKLASNDAIVSLDINEMA